MSFILQETNIVVGKLTFNIPTSERREYAKLLKSMAEVAAEHGKDMMHKEFIAAAKKLDGRGRKPSSDKVADSDAVDVKASASSDDAKSAPKPAAKTNGDKKAPANGTKTRISIKARPAEEDELIGLEAVEVEDSISSDDALAADDDVLDESEFNELV